MRLIERLPIVTTEGTKSVELFAGQLESLDQAPPADYLVVAAYPDDDSPIDPALSTALQRWNLSLPELFKVAALDRRSPFGCWISGRLPVAIDGKWLPFKRILCVESFTRSLPSDFVHDIFRSIALLQGSSKEKVSLLMPLSGPANPSLLASNTAVPIVGASAYWMGRGLPVHSVKLLVDQENISEGLEEELVKAGEKTQLLLDTETLPEYDLFISYAKVNQKKAIMLYNELLSQRPGLQIFLGQRGRFLGPGRQSRTFDALDRAKVVLSLLSPAYFRSQLCLRELHIAHHNQEHREGSIWLPAMVEDGELPNGLKIPSAFDFTQNSFDALRDVCHSRLIPALDGVSA